MKKYRLIMRVIEESNGVVPEPVAKVIQARRMSITTAGVLILHDEKDEPLLALAPDVWLVCERIKTNSGSMPPLPPPKARS